MAIVVASGTAVSIVANTKSADQVSGQYQHVGRDVENIAKREVHIDSSGKRDRNECNLCSWWY